MDMDEQELEEQIDWMETHVGAYKFMYLWVEYSSQWEKYYFWTRKSKLAGQLWLLDLPKPMMEKLCKALDDFDVDWETGDGRFVTVATISENTICEKIKTLIGLGVSICKPGENFCKQEGRHFAIMDLALRAAARNKNWKNR
jgi:hypothetical protein